jgi:hypothetical protein
MKWAIMDPYMESPDMSLITICTYIQLFTSSLQQMFVILINIFYIISHEKNSRDGL